MQQHFTDHKTTIEGQCNNVSQITFKVATNLILNLANSFKSYNKNIDDGGHMCSKKHP